MGRPEQISTAKKEATRAFLERFAEALYSEIAAFDSIHHELKIKVDIRHRVRPEGLASWDEQINELRAIIRRLNPSLLKDFRVYVASPEKSLFAQGESSDQTASELLSSLPIIQEELLTNKAFICAGYCFNILDIDASIAIVEPAYVMMTDSAPFADPFRKRLPQITQFLEKEGYIAMAYQEDIGLKVL